MNQEAADHLEAAKLSASEAVRDGWQMLFIAGAVLTGATTGSDLLEKVLPEGQTTEVITKVIDGGGIIAAGAIAIAGVGSFASNSTDVVYHHYKAWRIERKEARKERERHRFTPVSIYPPTQLNGNL